MASPVYIFHITHVDNLPSIIADGGLWSDRRVIADKKQRVVIGYDHIKQRRLDELRVDCRPGTMVGDYVPFYFCPRSPMLYKISRRDGTLEYSGGQQDIVHLVSTVETAISTAEGRRWAFSDGNAGARYTQFSADIAQLPTFVDWKAVKARRWSGQGIDPAVMSKKMAEFLVYERFPWTGFQQIGVMRPALAKKVEGILAAVDHQPEVVVKTQWYYPGS